MKKYAIIVALLTSLFANDVTDDDNFKEEDIPKILIGDGYRIEQILNNLISNAVKFTDGGIVMVNVNKVNRFMDTYEIKFSVEDMGIGLSEEEMKYIFKSFHLSSSPLCLL